MTSRGRRCPPQRGVTAEEEEARRVVMRGASFKRSDDGDHVENMMEIRPFSLGFHVSLVTCVDL